MPVHPIKWGMSGYTARAGAVAAYHTGRIYLPGTMRPRRSGYPSPSIRRTAAAIRRAIHHPCDTSPEPPGQRAAADQSLRSYDCIGRQSVVLRRKSDVPQTMPFLFFFVWRCWTMCVCAHRYCRPFFCGWMCFFSLLKIFLLLPKKITPTFPGGTALIIREIDDPQKIQTDGVF